MLFLFEKISVEIKISLKFFFPKCTIDTELTSFEIMAWRCEATIHFLSHNWPIPMLPYDVTRSQIVNIITYDTVISSMNKVNMYALH